MSYFRRFIGEVFLAAGLLSAQNQSYAEAKAALARSEWDTALAMASRLLEVNRKDVNALNIKGLALTGRGELRNADEAFEEALRIAPAFATPRKNLAVNQLALKQISEAEKNFKILLNAAPGDPLLHMYLAEIAFRRKEYGTAVPHLQSVKPFWDKDARLPVMMAECYIRLGHPAEGLRILKAAGTQGLNPIWQFHAGTLLANQQEYDSAIPFFEAARGGYPNPDDVLFNLGLCYNETHQYEEAIKVLLELRNGGNSAKSAELDNLLAQAYESTNETGKAIELLREATQLDPHDERNYVDLGMLCAEHNAYDLGLQVLEVGLHYLPESDALLMQRAVIYAMNGRYEDSEKDFLAASHNSNIRDSAYAGLGLTYLQQGDVNEAIKILRQRAKTSSDNAMVEYLLGESLIRTGLTPNDTQYEEALAALEKSVRLNPNFVHSRVDLAKLYLMRNQNAEAVAQLRKAISLDPTKVQAYAELGTALRKEGRMEEAAPMFAKVRELNEYKRNHEKHISLLGDAANGEPGSPAK